MKYQRVEDLLHQLKGDDFIKSRKDWPAYIDYNAIDLIIVNTSDRDINMIVNGSFIRGLRVYDELIVIRAFIELIRYMRKFFYHHKKSL